VSVPVAVIVRELAVLSVAERFRRRKPAEREPT
jgi:hypothetical protein